MHTVPQATGFKPTNSSSSLSSSDSAASTERVHRYSEAESGSTGKRGTLAKKGFWSNWKDAWFVAESSLLLEFKTSTSSKPTKVYDLRECVIKLAENLTGVPNSFAIFSKKKDPVFLLASNEVEKVEWVSYCGKYCLSSEIVWGKDQFLAAFNEAVIMASFSGTILSVNDAALELFQYQSVNDMIGKPLSMLMPPEYGAHHHVFMQRYADTGVKRLIGKPRQLPIVLADGTQTDIILSLGEMEQDKVKKIMATMRNVPSSYKEKEKIAESIKNAVGEVLEEAKKQMELKLEEELKDLYSQLSDIKHKNLELNLKLNKKAKVKGSKKHGHCIDTSDIRVNEKISNVSGGGGAMVYACTVDGWQCAMKELILDEHADSIGLETEILLLEALPIHKNLVRYLFHKKRDGRLRLFMTRYSSSLTSVLRARRREDNPLSLNEVISFSLDIVSGLCILHEHKIIHRDLKSDNIFVSMNPMGIEYLAVGDLDTAKMVTQDSVARTTLGTPGFISPEVLKSRNRGEYTSSVDVWSLGMVLYEMMSLKRPFEDEKALNVGRLIEEGKLPELPPQSKKTYGPILELWSQCLALDPTERPTAPQLKQSLKKLQTN